MRSCGRDGTADNHIIVVRRPSARVQRVGLVILLLGGAYLAVRPFVACAFPFGMSGPGLGASFAQLCAFGSGNANFDRGGPGPLWPYVLVAGLYVWAAIAVALTGRRWMAPALVAATAAMLVLVVGLATLYVTRTEVGQAIATARPVAVAPTVVPGPSTAIPKPHVLGSDCAYVDNGTVSGSATTWKILCPQGLPSNALRPSIEAQGWSSCGNKMWSKDQLQMAVIDVVNVSSFSGWLDQRPLSGGTCVQPTPPSSGTGPPP